MKKKIILGFSVVLLLVLVYLFTGNSDVDEITGTPTATGKLEITEAPAITEATGLTGAPVITEVTEITEAPAITEATELTMVPTITETIDITKTPTPALTQKPTEPPEPTETAIQYCYMSINCKNAIANSKDLNPILLAELPDDGVIMSESSIAFEEGDTVFDVLKHVTSEKGIALEYSTTPAYGSVYVEGLAELYQFDCGSLSGWIYTVNGVSASVSASEYKLRNNDKVEWIYTCNLGGEIQ